MGQEVRNVMRILLVTDYYPPILGGLSLVVQSLAKELHSRGHKVHVLTVSGGGFEESGFRIERIPHTSSFFPFLFKDRNEKNLPPIPDPLFMEAIRRAIRKFRPDTMHAHGWVMFPVSSYKLFNRQIGAVATLHDYGYSCAKRDLIPELRKTENQMICARNEPDNECVGCCLGVYGPVRAFAVVSCLKAFGSFLGNLDSVSAVSKYVAERAKKRLPIRIETMPNFMDLGSIDGQRVTAGEPAFRPDILFVGRLSPQKGIFLLLEAVKLLLDQMPAPKVAIVGKADPQFRIDIAQKSIFHEKNIRQNDLVSLYNTTKIVVVPSIWAEPQPMVALEAMAFAKPLVVTNVGGLKEMAEDHKTGLIVKTNPADLAAALQYLLSHPKEAMEMGLEGRRRLQKNYSSEIIVPRIEKMYEHAAK
jgi:glycosyltransferase involved in cell wall biosynthesis